MYWQPPSYLVLLIWIPWEEIGILTVGIAPSARAGLGSLKVSGQFPVNLKGTQRNASYYVWGPHRYNYCSVWLILRSTLVCPALVSPNTVGHGVHVSPKPVVPL